LDAHPAVSVWVVDPSFRRIGDAYVNLRAVVAMGYDEVAGRRQAEWNLEDKGVALRRLMGLALLAFGVAGFIAVPIAVWNFVRGDGGSSTDDAGYYTLLVPITIPATIIFVYLNWLSVSFFKSA